jgi:hypothetical protein
MRHNTGNMMLFMMLRMVPDTRFAGQDEFRGGIGTEIHL